MKDLRGRRTVIGICLFLALALVAAPAADASPTDPPLSILGTTTTPLTVNGEKGNDTGEAKFTLLNAGETGETAANISIGFQATSSEAVKVTSWSPEEVPPGKAQRITVQFSGLEGLKEAVTGQLVVTGGREPVAQSIEVAPLAPDTEWAEELIFGSLAATVLAAFFVVGAIGKEGRSRLLMKAPDPKWSFSSWATTLTAAGAVFGTVLNETTFPAVPLRISKTELVNLNILFVVLLLVGPFLFEVVRGFKRGQTGATRTGYNIMVLISCAFTMWAVVGQLGAFGLLGWELLGGDSGRALFYIACLFAIGALWYFVTTTSETLQRDWETEEKEAKQAEEKAAREGKCCPEPARPSWHLL